MGVFPAALLEPGYRLLGRTSAAARISENAWFGFGWRGNGGRNTRLEQGLQSNADHMEQAFFPPSVSVNITPPPIRVLALSPAKRWFQCGPLCGKCNPNQSWSVTMRICAPFSQHDISVCQTAMEVCQSGAAILFVVWWERRMRGEVIEQACMGLHVPESSTHLYHRPIQEICTKNAYRCDAIKKKCSEYGGISQQNKCLFCDIRKDAFKMSMPF